VPWEPDFDVWFSHRIDPVLKLQKKKVTGFIWVRTVNLGSQTNDHQIWYQSILIAWTGFWKICFEQCMKRRQVLETLNLLLYTHLIHLIPDGVWSKKFYLPNAVTYWLLEEVDHNNPIVPFALTLHVPITSQCGEWNTKLKL
jgi:hypothetical protein